MHTVRGEIMREGIERKNPLAVCMPVLDSLASAVPLMGNNWSQ